MLKRLYDQKYFSEYERVCFRVMICKDRANVIQILCFAERCLSERKMVKIFSHHEQTEVISVSNTCLP